MSSTDVFCVQKFQKELTAAELGALEPSEARLVEAIEDVEAVETPSGLSRGPII